MCPPNAGTAYHHRLNRRKYVVPTLGRHTGLPLHRNIYKVAKYRQVDIAESTSRYRQIHLSILRNRNKTALNSKLMQQKNGRSATERFPPTDLLGGLFKRILYYHVIYNQLALFVAAVHRSKGYQTADNHCIHSFALRYC